MHIKRLVIQNFRNFALLDIPISPGVTCIVGENNAGKSNLLEALRLAVDANLSSTRRQLAQEDFAFGTDISKPTHILVSVEFTGFATKPHEEAMVFGFNVEDNVARITYRFRPKPDVRETLQDPANAWQRLTIEDYRWEIRGGGAIDPAKAKWSDDFGKSVRFEELQQSYLVVFMEALRDVDQRLRQSRSSPLVRLLTRADVPQVEQDALVALLDEANRHIAKSATISTLGTELSGAFASAAGSAYKMGVKLGIAPPTFGDISKSLTVLLSSGALENLSTARNGLGLNNVLFISMLLHYFQRRVKEAKTAGQLLIVEEPESHLHPQLQRVLVQALQKGNFQSLLTTHSTHVTSTTPLNSVVILSGGETLQTTTCAPASNPGVSPAEIADLERYLDATRGTLLYARRVMLVEGPAELFLIPALVRAVMGINLDEVGISVVPIYGVHFGAYTKLFGPEQVQRKCAVVADSDLTPSDAVMGGEDPPPERPALALLRNPFVEIFCGLTTFERELASPETLPMILAAAHELGATKTYAKLLQAEVVFSTPGVEKNLRDQWIEFVKATTLLMAKNYGKARFAQVASKHVAKARGLPPYVINAVTWLMK